MSLPKELQDKWDEAERTGQPVGIGHLVVCDLCDEDHTDSDTVGGAIMGSKAICPKCMEKYAKELRMDAAEGMTLLHAQPGEKFGEFVTATGWRRGAGRSR